MSGHGQTMRSCQEVPLEGGLLPSHWVLPPTLCKGLWICSSMSGRIFPLYKKNIFTFMKNIFPYSRETSSWTHWRGPSRWVFPPALGEGLSICCFLIEWFHGTDVVYFFGCSFTQTIAINSPRLRTFFMGRCPLCGLGIFVRKQSFVRKSNRKMQKLYIIHVFIFHHYLIIFSFLLSSKSSLSFFR